MRNGLIVAAAVLQLFVLAYMAGEREWVVRTGQTVYFRTAPVDPRDPFRGDYVTLDYEISHIPTNCVAGALLGAMTNEPPTDGTRVYAALRLDGDLGAVTYLSNRKPDTGPFIRGRTNARQWWHGHNIHVRYGIEAYYVQQGKGKDIERARVQEGVQVPLEMEAALGGNGTAVLKGYRWSQLGTGLDTETVTVTGTNMINRVTPVRIVTAVTLVLLNASDRDVAIVDLPRNASLSLEPDQIRDWGRSSLTWVGMDKVASRPAPTDSDVRVLKPGEKYRFRVDLRDPAWFVSEPGQAPQTFSGIGRWNARFRLIYRPPTPDECRGLKNAGLIWHGSMPSRAFDGGGQID